MIMNRRVLIAIYKLIIATAFISISAIIVMFLYNDSPNTTITDVITRRLVSETVKSTARKSTRRLVSETVKSTARKTGIFTKSY